MIFDFKVLDAIIIVAFIGVSVRVRVRVRVRF
jgi:hypothetical protein